MSDQVWVLLARGWGYTVDGVYGSEAEAWAQVPAGQRGTYEVQGPLRVGAPAVLGAP